ncbi:MAG: 30S ribosomal protein S17 [Candidatus Paceibacterota bacterium]|jgi:small subunit ribosomal protein S17
MEEKLSITQIVKPKAIKQKRRLEGEVVSNRMQKTVVVRVSRIKRHPKYKKYYRVSQKFKAHDEKNQCQIGDKVIIEETKPLSKDKRWKVKGFVGEGNPPAGGEA